MSFHLKYTYFLTVPTFLVHTLLYWRSVNVMIKYYSFSFNIFNIIEKFQYHIWYLCTSNYYIYHYHHYHQLPFNSPLLNISLSSERSSCLLYTYYYITIYYYYTPLTRRVGIGLVSRFSSLCSDVVLFNLTLVALRHPEDE